MDDLHWRERNIIELLSRYEKLKTTDIIDNADMCKVTTLKYLSRLRKRGIIDYEMIGPTKLWYIKDEGNEQNLNPEGRKRVFELLRDLEEIIGIKADVIITSKGIALTLDDPVDMRQ
ncbi:MAG: hypothetical protein B6U86_00925 [Candidatus Altiarchaeales archaeon ex4484_43]|nr:MAG: hypothetical protein B6U86_00925 [Candidatus Altiarchaeales archaeon ex4484_43]